MLFQDNTSSRARLCPHCKAQTWHIGPACQVCSGHLTGRAPDDVTAFKAMEQTLREVAPQLREAERRAFVEELEAEARAEAKRTGFDINQDNGPALALMVAFMDEGCRARAIQRVKERRL